MSRRKRHRDRSSPRLVHPANKRVLGTCAAVVVILATVVAVDRPVLSAQAICLDDGEFLTDNPLVQNPGWKSTQRFFAEVLEPSTVGGYYLPLSMVSLMLDYAAGGRPDNLRPFHRTSLALHVANALLVFAILYTLFNSTTAALLVALLFGLHPLTVEPLAWIGERKTLLAAFFSFLSILAYLRDARRGSRIGRVLSLCAYVLALLSKPTAVPLPFLLLAMDCWPLRRLDRRAVWRKWPYFALAAVFAVITIISHARTAGIAHSPSAGWLEQPLRVCHLVAFYVGKVFWPTHLSSVYPAPLPMTLGNPVVLAAVIACVVTVVVVMASWPRTPALVAGAGFFVLGLAPTLGLVHYSWVYASDKYLYLPMLGLLLLIAWAFRRGLRAPSPALRAAVVVGGLGLCATEAVATRGYLRVWRDTPTLSEHILERAPRNTQIRVNLAAALEDRGQFADAIEQYREAIRIQPDYALAHNNLGGVLMKRGRTDEAVKEIETALRIKPDFAQAHNNLAVALLALGRIEDAEAHCLEAIRLKPGYPRPLFNLANIRRVQGRLDDAVAYYRQAITLDRDFVEAHRNLGAMLMARGSVEEAVAHLSAVVRLRPDEAAGYDRLGFAEQSLGRLDAAAEHYTKALTLSPNDARAHFGLGSVLAMHGHRRLALEHLQAAVQIKDGWAAPLNAMAWILAASPDDALRDPTRAVDMAARAAELTGYKNPQVLDTLAVAQAATGRFEQAVETATRALDLLGDTDKSGITVAIRARLDGFRRKQAYVEPPTGAADQ